MAKAMFFDSYNKCFIKFIKIIFSVVVCNQALKILINKTKRPNRLRELLASWEPIEERLAEIEGQPISAVSIFDSWINADAQLQPKEDQS